MKKLIAVLLSSLIIMAGCSYGTNVENQAFVVAVGIDEGKSYPLAYPAEREVARPVGKTYRTVTNGKRRGISRSAVVRLKSKSIRLLTAEVLGE